MSNIKEYAELQYKNDQNLKKRINLWSYGNNPVSFYEWIFKKTEFKKNDNVLELGCGTGQFWLENQNKIPLVNSIILSDFSKKMVKQAKRNLRGFNLPVKFKVINAENIPFTSKSFDVILGCNMLIHIPKMDNALKSINRVLKPEGKFISTTISTHHTQELKDFLVDFGLSTERELLSEFRNETGEKILQSYFSDIKFFEYINKVVLKSADPLISYINSMFPNKLYPDFQDLIAKMTKIVKNIIEKEGEFRITGISGLFIATNPINK